MSTRKLANATGTSRTSVQRIIKNNLHLKSYKLKEAHLLTNTMKETRLERAKILKKRFAAGRHRSILLFDEKIFIIEQSHNHKNDMIWYLEVSSQDRIVNRSQKQKSVMVWAGITFDGKAPLIFIEEDVKINQMIYRTMLQDKVLPWAQEQFRDRHWTFQQDSAPPHKARDTLNWIEENFPSFLSPQEWLPYSPDLNPMDFSIWSILDSNAYTKPHISVAALKRSLVKAWDEISLETIEKVTDNFPKR